MDKKEEDRLIKLAKRIIGLYGEGAYEQCLECCEKILVDYPYDLNTLEYKGVCLTKLERYNEAIEALSRGISAVDDKYSAYVFRGDAYFKLGEFESAAEDYRKSLELEPTNGGAMSSYAQSVYLSGNKAEGIALMKKVVAMKEDPNPVLILEIMLNSVGSKEEARLVGMFESANFPDDKRFDKHRN